MSIAAAQAKAAVHLLLIIIWVPELYCQQNLVISKSALCGFNRITFSITFQRPFAGLIYSDGTFSDPSCRYVDGSIYANTFYNLTIPLDRCRSQTLPDGTQRNTVIIQRDPRILEVTDNKFVLTCNPRTSGNDQLGPSGQFTVTLGGITVDATLASTEVVTNTRPLSALDYTVQVQLGQGPFGVPVSRSLNVGEPISYVITLRNMGTKGARIGRCWATDGISNIQLSDDNGCSLQPPNSNVWSTFQVSTSVGQIIFYNNIKTWAFPTSSRVNIFCNLHVCPTQLTCPQPNCPPRVGRSVDQDEPRPLSDDIESAHHRLSGPTNANLRLPVVKLAGSYEVVGDVHTDEVIAAMPQVISPSVRYKAGLVTGAPLAVYGPSVDVIEASEDRICVPHLHFVAGICLILIVVLLSLAAVGIAVRQNYVRRKQLKTTTGSSNSGTLRHHDTGYNTHSMLHSPDNLSYLGSHPSSFQLPSMTPEGQSLRRLGLDSPYSASEIILSKK